MEPLTNAYQNRAVEFSDLSTKTLYNVAEEDESEPVRYNPPATPPMMAHGQIPACGLMKDEEVELYAPENLHPNSIAAQQVVVGHLQGEMVVNRIFSNNIPELTDMISMPEAVSSGMPVYHQAHLIQQEPVLPQNLDQFDEEPAFPPEEEVEASEQFGLLHGYVYSNAQVRDEDDLAEAKLAMEGSLALMPPSPFRDSAGSPASPFPNSPVSESILCSPPNVTYASVILSDFKQSSSTL